MGKKASSPVYAVLLETGALSSRNRFFANRGSAYHFAHEINADNDRGEAERERRYRSASPIPPEPLIYPRRAIAIIRITAK